MIAISPFCLLLQLLNSFEVKIMFYCIYRQLLIVIAVIYPISIMYQALYIHSHLSLFVGIRRQHHVSYFTAEEAEFQRGPHACSRSQNLRQDYKACAFLLGKIASRSHQDTAFSMAVYETPTIWGSYGGEQLGEHKTFVAPDTDTLLSHPRAQGGISCSLFRAGHGWLAGGQDSWSSTKIQAGSWGPFCGHPGCNEDQLSCRRSYERHRGGDGRKCRVGWESSIFRQLVTYVGFLLYQVFWHWFYSVKSSNTIICITEKWK